ncbi:MAG: DNA primase [Chloroflexi bacterium]|nr:DNA primase [Chloroflexota bacterium]
MSLVTDVKGRLDIVEVVSQYVGLSPSGRSLKARCPFHQERTPSFFVFPDRQSWRCFGACAAGGDVVTFVMKAENLGFGAALKLLAARAGVNLPERRGHETQDPLYQVNDAAASFYHEHLLMSVEGEKALRYLEGRGVSRDSLQHFRLGLSPGGWESLKRHLLSRGHSEELGVQAGLLHRSEDGRTRDLFHGRLMFPIHNPQGRVAGLGGRSLDGSEPKYLNSPRTPVFEKGHLLYGLHHAAEAIRKEGVGVVVEGYMDALMAHQHGFRNVVASMGTALTEHQVALLTGMAGTFVLALDPDAAGQEATLRSLEGAWRVFEHAPQTGQHPGGLSLYQRASQKTLKVALLPAAKDPDETIRDDPSQWRSLIAGATPLVDYLMGAAAARFDLASPQGKSAAAQAILPLIYGMENPFQQEHAFQRLAQLLGVRPEVLEASAGRPRPASGRRPRPVQASPAPFARISQDPLEEYTLALLLQHPELKSKATDLDQNCFQHAENRELFILWIRSSTIELLKQQLPDALSPQVETLCSTPLPPADSKTRQDALSDCLRRLEERRLRELKAQEELVLSQGKATAEEGPDLGEQALELNQRLRQIFHEGAHRSQGSA